MKSDIRRPSLPPRDSSPGLEAFGYSALNTNTYLNAIKVKSENLKDITAPLSELQNLIMRTTQTSTPTADGLVQCMQDMFGAAVFHTEYFFIEQSQSMQTAGSCYY